MDSMRSARILRLLLPVLIARGLPSDRFVSCSSRHGRAGRDKHTATTAAAKATAGDLAYVCPMDRDIRSNEPGKCPRCGMALVAGIPDPTEYHLDLTVTPKPPQPGEQVRPRPSRCSIRGRTARSRSSRSSTRSSFTPSSSAATCSSSCTIIRTWENGDPFTTTSRFPKPGMYRILGDFYPGSGDAAAASPRRSSSPERRPPAAHAGARLLGEAGRQSAGRLLDQPVGSDRRRHHADALHAAPRRRSREVSRRLGSHAGRQRRPDRHDPHPPVHRRRQRRDAIQAWSSRAPRVYRVWVQFQRNGVVNTAHFDVPVKRRAAAN